jgi:hypothetical protein
MVGRDVAKNGSRGEPPAGAQSFMAPAATQSRMSWI